MNVTFAGFSFLQPTFLVLLKGLKESLWVPYLAGDGVCSLYRISLNLRTFGRSDEWKNNVLRNSAQRVFRVADLKPGNHKLTIHMIDPGVILNHIFIDLGVDQPFYGSLAPTYHSRESVKNN